MVAAPPDPSTEHPSTERESREHPSTEPAPSDPSQRDPGPPGVDPQGPLANEEPSVEWGWHGIFPRATRIAGWFTAASMFFMLIGNHESNIENWWLVALGTGLVVLLLRERLSRNSWRR